MKKIFTLFFGLTLLVLFSYYYKYTNDQFDYRVASKIWNFCQWSLIIFIINIFALSLDIKKYKIWLFISIIFVAASILLAYNTGDGNGAIVSIDGEMQTWFLSGFYSLVSIIYFTFQHFRGNRAG
jgi:hypothetical protein